MASLSVCSRATKLHQYLDSSYHEILNVISDQNIPIELQLTKDGCDTGVLRKTPRFIDGKFLRELNKLSQLDLSEHHTLHVTFPYMRRSMNLPKAMSLLTYYSKFDGLQTNTLSPQDQSDVINSRIEPRFDHTETFDTNSIVDKYEALINDVRIITPFTEYVRMTLSGVEINLPITNDISTKTIVLISFVLWCVTIATVPLAARRDYIKFILKGGFYCGEEKF